MGVNHRLSITVTAVGTKLGDGTATAGIMSGAGCSGAGSSTCSLTGWSSAACCTVVITSTATGTTVVSATSSIPLTGGGSITRTTDGTAGNSGPASKTWADATIAITPATATNAVGIDRTPTMASDSVGTTPGTRTTNTRIRRRPANIG